MATSATLDESLDASPKPSPLIRWTLPLLAIIAVVGLPALVYRLYAGLVVTNLGSVVPWGVWVAFYIYFIGLSAGSFLLSTVVYVFKYEKLEPVGRIALLQAFFCLLTGMIFIFIDLGPDNLTYPHQFSKFLGILGGGKGSY